MEKASRSLTNIRTNRNSSIELVKLIAVFLIICSSALPYGVTYNGGYDSVYVNLNNTEFSATHIVFTLFRWFGQIGDTLFIVCSAWFLCDSSRIKLKKAFKMIADSWVISVAGLIVALLLLSPQMTEIVKSLFPVTFQLNWFVGCYIIYYLIHPMLNKAIDGLENKSFKRLIITLFIAYSIVGTVMQKYYYTNLVAFICIHYFVMFYKRYGQDKFIRSKDMAIVVGSATLIVGWIICINFLGNKFGFLETKNLLGCTYINPIIIFIGIAILDIAVHREFHNVFVNAVAKCSLLIYLFHANYFWLSYGKYWIWECIANTGIGKIGTVEIIIALYVVVTIVLSVAYDISIGKLTTVISDKIAKKFE